MSVESSLTKRFRKVQTQWKPGMEQSVVCSTLQIDMRCDANGIARPDKNSKPQHKSDLVINGEVALRRR